MMATTSCRYYFDSIGSAAEALSVVLLNARNTKVYYRFGSLSAQQISTSGLHLEGELEEIKSQLDKVSGSVRYDD